MQLPSKRVAIYARVSTMDQTCEPQLRDLRAYVTARSWQAIEFVDQGVSGTKEKRPGLDRLLREVKARRIDVVVVAAFDRFSRSVRHLVETLELFRHLGVEFVSLREQIDTGSPLGQAVFTIVAAIAELERSLIAERGAGRTPPGASGRQASWSAARRSRSGSIGIGDPPEPSRSRGGAAARDLRVHVSPARARPSDRLGRPGRGGLGASTGHGLGRFRNPLGGRPLSSRPVVAAPRRSARSRTSRFWTSSAWALAVTQVQCAQMCRAERVFARHGPQGHQPAARPRHVSSPWRKMCPLAVRRP
jgi:predicted site-specific integrase-resolvase